MSRARYEIVRAVFAAWIAAFAMLGCAAHAQETRLLTLPQNIYFTIENQRENVAATIFFLFVETTDSAELELESGELVYREGGTVVGREMLSKERLDAINVPDLSPERLYGAEANPAIQWPHGLRIQSYMPADLPVDEIWVDLQLSDGSGAIRRLNASLPVARYAQQTDLIFPFRGPGLVSQTGALGSGHRNRSGLYAVDAIGLSADSYGPMLNGDDYEDLSTHAGWGRPVIAPAAGTIVVARSDRPDQPRAGNSDPEFYAPEFPDGGDPGNHVVIDHGNGEFSMIAHFQSGSLEVSVGDRVEAGQQLGLMGNSGDSSGPHVHYQLQNGADWQHADALPFAFTNVRSLARGSFFTAE